MTTELKEAIDRFTHAHRHETCIKCAGTGKYRWRDRYGNDNLGTCFTCRGKGYMDAKDRQREKERAENKLYEALRRNLAAGQRSLFD